MTNLLVAVDFVYYIFITPRESETVKYRLYKSFLNTCT